jgi:hypothetical protein
MMADNAAKFASFGRGTMRKRAPPQSLSRNSPNRVLIIATIKLHPHPERAFYEHNRYREQDGRALSARKKYGGA